MKKIKSQTVIGLLALAVALPLMAADSGRINYQARLLDSYGRRVNATVDLSFKIYDADSEGNLLWSETQADVVVQDGVYSVILGSQTPIPASIFAQNNVYLELGINAETMTPRQQITGSAYALVARTVAGSNIFENQSSGNVGIGTVTPASKLDVNGTIQATGFKMTTGASQNYVLVSDADGVGTWQSISVVITEVDPIHTNWVQTVFRPATNDLWTAVGVLNTATNTLNTRVGTAETDVTALKGATNTLNLSTNALQIQATALQDATNTLNLSTNALQVQATALQDATNALQIQVTSNKFLIDNGPILTNTTSVSVGQLATGISAGVAVGYLADGSLTGVAVGASARGTNFGVALGYQANSPTYGVALGYQAKSPTYGVALGYQANGSVNGAAVGRSANGYDSGAALGWSANASTDGASLGREASSVYFGAAVGYQANASNVGVAVGYQAIGYDWCAAVGPEAKGYNSGAALGWLANGAKTNVAIGTRANAQGGTERIAIGHNVTNEVDDSAVIRGTLYLDGGTGIVYRATPGAGVWISAKAFTIPHPLDPENKVLRHFCLEGPQVWNVYAGNAQLVNGQAVVELPDYYSALNLVGSEIYSLTVVGALAQIAVGAEASDNRFTIIGDKDVKVSWTIKVLRNDPDCLEDLRRRPVEQLKNEIR